MPKIPASDLPRYVRDCYERARKANEENRKAARERLRFYVGGDLQWRDEEINKRRNQQRPWITINKCKPAVDQIEGDIRLNPPGPQCHPVGGGADSDTADIIAGLIRETEYRSGAKTAYSTAGKYVAASGEAYIELATEYVSDRDIDSQRLVILPIEDPNCVFFDPSARCANRQDAGWAGKVKMYSKPDYVAAFGKQRRVLQPRMAQAAAGWLMDAVGASNSLSQINEWTGMGDGPFYVCEFYIVETEIQTLRMYSDMVARFDYEVEETKLPKGVKALEDPNDKNRYIRKVPRRKVCKYLVDALEVLDETEWLGDLIPIIPVLGPEVYIDGQLHRLSLIAGAMDSQRALNYVATTAAELTGILPKSPWIGPKGSFDDPRWQVANTEVQAYLEYTPVFVTDETTGQQQLAPPPVRNMWEAPIQWLVQLGQWFSDHIKATTAIYDPSLGAQKNDQSGKAIEQLRSESSVGNYSYTDNLHRAIEIMYQQMCLIFQKIYDRQTAATIVKPNSDHEAVILNQLFTDQDGKEKVKNNIRLGEYSVRVTVGPSMDTRNREAIPLLIDLIKTNPQALAVPGVAASVFRIIGDGNPEIEGIADMLAPPTNGEIGPAQIQALQQQNQQLRQLAQQMHQAIQAKLPEIEAKKFQAVLDSLTKIRVAEINASKDLDKQAADNMASLEESMLGMAHETALAHAQQEHEQSIQQSQQTQAAAQQASDQAQAAQEEPTNA